MEQGWEVGVIGAPAANDPLGVIRLGLVVERPSGLIRGFEILEDPDDFQQLMVRAEAAPMAGTVDKPPIVWVATADVGAAVRGTLVGRRATLCVTDELPALARVAAGMEEQSPFSGPLYPPDFPGARDVARLMAVAARLAELRPWETSDESRVLVLDDGAGGVCVTLGGAGTCFGLVLYPDVHTYASVTLDAQAGLSPGPNCNWTALWFDPVDRVPDMARLVMRGLGWTNPDYD